VSTAALIDQLASALSDVVRPLQVSLASPAQFEGLLRKHGWRPPPTQEYFGALSAAIRVPGDVDTTVATLDELVADDNAGAAAAAAALAAAVKLLDDLRRLTRPSAALPAPFDRDDFWSTFFVDVVADLFTTYLERAQPAVFAPLYLLGIIDDEAVGPSDAGRLPYLRHRIHWERMGRVLSNPAALAGDVYGWSATLDHDKLMRRLERALLAFGVPAGRHQPFHALTAQYYPAASPRPATLRELRVPLLVENRPLGGAIEAGLAALPVPPAPGQAPRGLLIGPYLHGHADTRVPVGGAFALQLTGGLESAGAVGLELFPERVGVRLGGATSADASMTLAGKPALPWVLAGDERSDRLELLDLAAAIELAGTAGDLELKLHVSTTGLRLTLDPGGADGFLRSVLGTDLQQVAVSGGLVWSSKTGLHLEGQAGLSGTIPVDVTLGPLRLDQLAVDVKASNSRVATALGVSGSLRIGPVVAAVQDVGLQVTLAAADPPGRGTFGDLDVGFGFKPPAGLGLSIDAPVVSGGGFLSCEPDLGRYTGALHVKIAGTIDIAAWGILETGAATEHWSLIVILAGHIPPIELGWNFRLTGLGGVLALHRRMDTDALRDAAYGIRGTLDDLLFPDSPETRLPQLLSTITRFFPASAGSYVAGPMAEIEWGRGAEVNARIRAALLLQLDAEKIALYGTLRIGFPTVDADSILRIRAGLEALVDLRNEFARFSITLIEAKLFQSIQVTGGAAFFVRWGSGREFAFTIGGFHPAYRPYIPSGLVEPPRVGVHWNPFDGVRLDLSQYFAVTTTSMQFGADAHAEIGCSWGKVSGELAFDVLVMTSPSLLLEADLHARVTVSVFGADLLSAGLDGSLTGPGPWVLSGQANWKVWVFGISKSFHFEWGDRVSIPAAPQSAGDILGAEMQLAANWTSFRTRALPVKLRSGVSAPLAPRDEIEVRQSRLPFGTAIETMEGNPLTDAGVWTLTCSSGSGVVKLFDVTETFPERCFLAKPSKDRPFRGALTAGAHLARADWDVSAVAIAVAGTATDDVVVDGGAAVPGAVPLAPPAVHAAAAGALPATSRLRAFSRAAAVEVVR
jgi:hypothetical protein